jgi:AcrR family transcriptional regulator
VKTIKVFKVSSRIDRAVNPLRARIVAAARDLFFKSGFVRVRSDDIAARLGISKATLYKHFPSKEAILRAVVTRTVASYVDEVEAIVRDDSRDFVEKMIGLMAFLNAVLSTLRSELARDIERYAPEIWTEIDEFRRKKILDNFKILIEAGVREGALRPDIDRDALVLIWLTLVQNLMTPEAIARLPYSGEVLFGTLLKVVFEGLLTEEGRRRYAGRPQSPFALKKEVRP